MEVLESHEELIESKSEDISMFWKVLQIFFYFVSIISGYGSAILFHLLWDEIFAGHCPIWAHVYKQVQPRIRSEVVPVEEVIAPALLTDWRHKITITFPFTDHCSFYHFVSLSSCIFGIVWMTLFTMCGKGGYDTGLFVQPWTIVPPALIFQIIFSMLVLIVVHDLDHGYSTMMNALQAIASTTNETLSPSLGKPCDFLQSYLETFGPQRHYVCKIYSILQILSWLMAWSWLLGLAALIIRVSSSRDFTLFTVKLYKNPKEETNDLRTSIKSPENT
ncbi:uncharacterized protein [Venturia canescens]|uniref:uncharacterized protein n=1 Tax=Venturia canescens TaxID=32260 RepID=UPI001C9CC0C8|nr:uncharacterized protein LOC122409453 [Venturia canescens]